MILPVSNLRTSSSANKLLSKGLYVSNNSTTLTQECQHKNSQISFGDDGNMPLDYNWHSSFKKIYENNKIIKGNTLEDAFTNLYTTIQNDLNQMAKSENAKEAAHRGDGVIKSTFVKGREYDVKTEIPISQAKFVKATSAFAAEYGLRPKLADPNSAIKNIVANRLAIEQPKGFFQRMFSVTEYSITSYLLSETHTLMKKGLIVASSVK